MSASRKKAAALLLLTVCSLGLLETGLRLVGYTGRVPFLAPDPSLRWRPVAGFRSEAPSLDVRIDAAGFRDGPGRDFPPDALRIACLGDSCTFGPVARNRGIPYPRRLAGILEERGQRAVVLNAGVPGYSVFQGLGWFRESVLTLRPDAVTIWFGWNDHWENADGRPDPQQTDSFRSRILCLRSVQGAKALWYAWAAGGLAGSASDGSPDGRRIDLSRMRVPPALYRELLLTLGREIRRSGGRPLFLTAPCGLSDEHAGRDVPFGVGSRAARRVSTQAYIDLHRAYQGLTREAAGILGGDLVDLEAVFEREGKTALFDDPLQDPIHPNGAGYALIARTLAAALQAIR